MNDHNRGRNSTVSTQTDSENGLYKKRTRSPSPVNDTGKTSNGDSSEEERRKELRKKERLAKLAKWKAEKAKANEEGNTGSSSLNRDLSRTPTPTRLSNEPTTKLKLAASKPARSIFLGDDDIDTLQMIKRPLKKLPTLSMNKSEVQSSKISTDQNIEIDPLDAYMKVLSENTHDELTRSLPDLLDESGSEFDEAENQISGEFDPEGKLTPEEYMAMLEKKRKKDIPPVDHSKMNYEPFRKNFYVEPQEIAEMSEQEADQIRLELDGIKIRGRDCPKPVLKWAHFGLSAPVMRMITDVLAYEKPSSIQGQAIPAIMSGRDVIGIAKTGSGKTMAFLLPMFRHIKDQRPLSSMEGPIGLLMTPTRELATQIYRDCKPFLKALGLRAVCAYGGAPIKEQIAELKRGAEIVVCTPGRMIDLLTANQGRVTNLSRVTYLVLDEADRMFDMGFEPQVMKMIRNIRPDRQTVLFSATFPKQMEVLAKKILVKPVEIIVGARSVVAPEITQTVEVVADSSAKFLRTLQLLGQQTEDSGTLIFVERQEAADALFRDLIAKGYPSLVVHGGKEQSDRDSAISDFKQGVVNLLIATSVAARGLDVKHLRLVINYDAPNHMEDYVHRVGRTGRAGNKGEAVTFLLPSQDRAAVDIVKALKLSKTEVPEDVQKLADQFMNKVKEGKDYYSKKGFKGKGLEKLEVARQQQRQLERRAYGEEDETNEENEETESNVPTAENTFKQAVIMRGTEASTVHAGAAPDNKGPDVSAYHAKLEINDFPINARWQVSSRNNQAKIIEANGVSLTLKGIYYPPGKGPAEAKDEPKLYLLIEGPDESSVLAAYQQLQGYLKGGIDQNAQSRGGRYKV